MVIISFSIIIENVVNTLRLTGTKPLVLRKRSIGLFLKVPSLIFFCFYFGLSSTFPRENPLSYYWMLFPFPTQTLSFHCSKVKRKRLVHQFKKWTWEVGRQNLRDNYRLKWGILGFNLPASHYRLFKILLVPFWFVRFFLCLFENVLFVVGFFVVDILTAELMKWRNSWLVVCNMQQIQLTFLMLTQFQINLLKFTVLYWSKLSSAGLVTENVWLKFKSIQCIPQNCCQSFLSLFLKSLSPEPIATLASAITHVLMTLEFICLQSVNNDIIITS